MGCFWIGGMLVSIQLWFGFFIGFFGGGKVMVRLGVDRCVVFGVKCVWVFGGVF